MSWGPLWTVQGAWCLGTKAPWQIDGERKGNYRPPTVAQGHVQLPCRSTLDGSAAGRLFLKCLSLTGHGEPHAGVGI